MADYLEADPSELLEGPKIGFKLPEVLTVEEIDRIISAVDRSKAEGQRNRAILETLYSWHSISGQPTQRSAASFLHSMADSLSYLSDGHFLSEQIASEEPGNLHIGCFAGITVHYHFSICRTCTTNH